MLLPPPSLRVAVVGAGSQTRVADYRDRTGFRTREDAPAPGRRRRPETLRRPRRRRIRRRRPGERPRLLVLRTARYRRHHGRSVR
jgi:hypothetical protein